MQSNRYVALLRGINVGGKNGIKMVDLRAGFAAMGFDNVETYIQSGNVVFATKRAAKAPALTTKIEATLSATFGYESRVAVVPASDVEKAVTQAPDGFGTEPGVYLYDVIFVLPPTKPSEVAAQLSAREGVDEMHVGNHAVYFRRLQVRSSQSHLPRLSKLPVYKLVTVRNWNTTTKLLAMLSGPD